MNRRAPMCVMIACTSILAAGAVSAEAPGEASKTAQWMIEQEKAWAEQSCGQKWVLANLLAADFRGTSPKGKRYDKPSGEPALDPATPFHTDCRLLEADVRFFGPSVAVVYGSESSVATLPDSTPERRCLVWTDTWLKRDGKWQIIAAQDTRVDCP